MKRKFEESVCECNPMSGWKRRGLIGSGGFGCVYLAVSSSSNNTFLPPVMAIKLTDLSHSVELMVEKSLLSDLRGCPNIIQCFGDDVTTITESGDLIFNLVLEYASGGSLDDLIERSNGHNGLSEASVRHYTRSILEGLWYVHECNVVHCDIKPDNILLVPNNPSNTTTTEFIPKISDFGLAKKTNSNNKLRGSPMYLSPEAILDQNQEQPSDIWALGSVVLKMLTGKQPWDMEPDSTVDDLSFRIASENESSNIPSEISKEGKDFLMCCFERNPHDRLTAAGLLNHPFISDVSLLGKADIKESSPPMLFEDEDGFIPLKQRIFIL